MIVAIDGPAGCGKSTIARMISRGLGFAYINSGNIYRAIALLSLRKEIPLNNVEKLIAVALSADLDCDEEGAILIDGVRLDAELRSAAVDSIVSQVSAIPRVRDIVNSIVRRLAQKKDAITEGRDMTTVVFPHADVKFYLDASVEDRAKRRFEQGSSSMSYSEILDNIRMRDAIDTTKPVGALKISDDAEYLDTSGLTIEQVYEKVNNKILHSREAHGE